jgi:cation diffusion facilitator CzcD-associated flavoprotein CzcO
MDIRLKTAGQNAFVIMERADEPGGTWRDNIYPGCACDIPSLVYSFSFDQNPNWSRHYPTQPEILAYLKQCIDKFNLRSHICYNSEVTKLQFEESTGCWQVQTEDGRFVTARHVVSAIGPLNRPHIPDIPGLETFQGNAFHSSQWDADFDPEGKRIVTIGTGASAIQFIPQIAPSAAQVTIFQRSPPWILPRGDHAISERHRRWFNKIPGLQNLWRGRLYWLLELGVLGFLGNERVKQAATDIARRHMARQIADPVLRQMVTPNYEFGCKRVLVSDDYYPALQQENVELVTAGIREVRSHTIVDNDGVERPLDALIFGTGFIASEILIDMEIVGRNGRELISEWQESGPEAYYGFSVSGYPNLFFLLGPNTGLGHNSVLLMMESQYNYILDYFHLLKKKRVPFLDIKPEVQSQHNQEIQTKLATTVWQAGGCKSWYQTAAGKNTTLWPGSTVSYRLKTRRAHVSAYD